MGHRCHRRLWTVVCGQFTTPACRRRDATCYLSVMGRVARWGGWVAVGRWACLARGGALGVDVLRAAGGRETARGGVGYVLGRVLAELLGLVRFYALYRGLPRRRPQRSVALVGAITAALLFDVARHLFSLVVRHLDPSSLYTGSIAAIVAVVFWTYYSAFLFLIGGEVAQAYGLQQLELTALLDAPSTAARRSSR